MSLFLVALVAATVLCSLVAGFLFAFAVVAMPGIGRLSDREFIRAFQVMDRIIQDNHPLFLVVWVGSVVTIIAAFFLGFRQLAGAELLLMIAATLTYVFGVQLPTVTINIPLNNKLQSLNTTALDDAESAAARRGFEPRWNKWNQIRTALSFVASALLVLLVALL